MTRIPTKPAKCNLIALMTNRFIHKLMCATASKDQTGATAVCTDHLKMRCLLND